MPLDPKLVSDFVRHVAIENGNAITYQSCYAWLRANSWEGIAKKFKNDSVDELKHGQNFCKYLARFGNFVPSTVDAATMPTALSPIAIAEFSAKLEQDTADSMRTLLEVAEEVGDGDAAEYVSGKLVEQSKEAKKAKDFSDQIAKCDDNALVLINRKMENGNW